MKKHLGFNRNYFVLAILLFFIEVIIAVNVHNRIVRPYIGDFLVVILIYCFVKSFLKTSVLKTALVVLLFSYLVEILQYFNIVNILGLQNIRLAIIIISNSFKWIDLIAYTTGMAAVFIVEKIIADKNRTHKINII